jgi:hypothetical protein
MSVKPIHGGKGNVVIAGETIFSGLDEDSVSKCKIAMTIEFDSKEDMRAAMASGYATFTLFKESTTRVSDKEG